MIVCLGAVREGPVPSKMPLTNTSGTISVVPKDIRNRGPFGLKQRRVPLPDNTRFETRSPAVTAGHYSIATGGADAGGSVSVGKTHPLVSEPVQVGRGDPGVWIVTSKIAISHVVC